MTEHASRTPWDDDAPDRTPTLSVTVVMHELVSPSQRTTDRQQAARTG